MWGFAVIGCSKYTCQLALEVEEPSDPALLGTGQLLQNTFPR